MAGPLRHRRARRFGSGPVELKSKLLEQTARPTLRSDFAWTLAGNVARGFGQWAILSLIAKLGGAEMLGEYALALAVTMPVAMLSHLNLRAVLATDVAGEHPFGDYMAVRIGATAAGIAALAILAAAVGGATPLAGAIFLLGLSLTAENVSDLYHGYLQRRERLDLVARSTMLRVAASLAAAAAALLAFRSVLAATAGLATGRAAVLFAYDRPVSGRPRGSKTSRPWTVFRHALPLGAALMLTSLITNVPRYAIERFLGTRELGAFAAAASFVTLGATVVNALGQSATTRLARAHREGDRQTFFRTLAGMVLAALALGAAGVAAALLIGGRVLAVFFRPEFAAYDRVMAAVLAAGAAGYVAAVLGYGATAARVFAPQMPLLACSAAAAAAASCLLVPACGLYGAAAAIGIAGLAQIAGVVFILRHRL